jgi:hypothetical protein
MPIDIHRRQARTQITSQLRFQFLNRHPFPIDQSYKLAPPLEFSRS